VRIRAIVNPKAGRGARDAVLALSRTSSPLGSAEVHLTGGPGEGRDLAREAAEKGYDLVLASGGDGTANEVASGLLGSRTTFGLLPFGSGNGLGRALRIPLEPERALEALATAETRLMDVGFVNGRPFLNAAGAGFDAVVGAAFQNHGRNGGRRGLFGYFQLGLEESFRYRADNVVLEAGSERFQGRAFIVAFLNGRQYGGGAVVAPEARMNDGLLEVVVFEEAPLLETFLNVPRLFVGGIEGYRAYRHFSARSATLVAEEPVRHHRDGEPEDGTTRIDVTVERRALRLLVPRRGLFDPAGVFSDVPNP
jgi:YegS/Rv2252/BmrU family lipid kinase